MLFHLATEDHIRAINEQEPAQTNGGGTTFTSEQELHELAKEWPMKRLVAIWNHLPGVQPVTRFTDRKTAITRIWRAIQPQTEVDSTTARPRHKTAPHQPTFREGSKAEQVLTLLCRPEGATLKEIRNQTGWQAHTDVRALSCRRLHNLAGCKQPQKGSTKHSFADAPSLIPSLSHARMFENTERLPSRDSHM